MVTIELDCKTVVDAHYGDKTYHIEFGATLMKCKQRLSIFGTFLQPTTTNPLFDAWQRCNHMVVPWITRTLSPQILQSTASFDTARDLLLDLQIRFSRGNRFRMSDLFPNSIP